MHTTLVALTLVAQLTWVVMGLESSCVDIPTEDIRLDELVGYWYPMEIVLHRNDSKIYGVPVDSQCPEVTITAISKKSIRMLWNTTDGHVEYRFVQKGKPSSPQFQVTGEQTGSKAVPVAKFDATVMAMDRDKYMIIRLCSGMINNLLLLSKRNVRSQEVLNSFGNQLAKYPYPQHDKLSLCTNNNGISYQLPTSVLFTSLSVLVLLLRQ